MRRCGVLDARHDIHMGEAAELAGSERWIAGMWRIDTVLFLYCTEEHDGEQPARIEETRLHK